MSDLSAEIIVWIVAISIVIFSILVWGMYRFLSNLLLRGSATSSNASSEDGFENANKATLVAGVNKQPEASEQPQAQKQAQIPPPEGPQQVAVTDSQKQVSTSDANTTSTNPLPDIDNMNNVEIQQEKPVRILKHRNRGQRKRFVDRELSTDSRSSDTVLHKGPETSVKSVQSAVVNKMRDQNSNSSRKSTGFEPTMKAMAAGLTGQKSQNFLELLDKVTAIDQDQDYEEVERKERQRRRRKRDEVSKMTTTSSSGIEASPSDETASMTFIGKGPEARPDPGPIQLELIKAVEDDGSE